MRKMAVIITLRVISRRNREELLRQLRELNAEHVFIGIGSPKEDEALKLSEFELLKDACAYFKEQGFKVAVWLWAFLLKKTSPYQHMIGINGIESDVEICPLDDAFVDFYTNYIKGIAEYANPDMILFDDDFAFGFLNDVGIGCVCPAHLKMISEYAGEEVELEGIEKKLFTGKANKYRDAYIKAMRDTLINHAKKLRSAVNMVNPTIRLGVCSLLSSWNVDGVSSYELAEHLAGDTKPFVRLIGAPYWAVDKLSGNNRLQDVINLQRMEASWRSGDVEVIHEGDVYPRPRFATPASFLEIYDTALFADGTGDGILKYIVDFNSSEQYEQGYIKRHLKNAPVYEWIAENMREKSSAGMRVYEFMHAIKTSTLPEEYVGDKYIQGKFLSPASKMLSACSVPLTYQNDGCCGVAFGDNVRYLNEEQLKGGLIIDATAAKALEEMGIDCGVIKWEGDFTPFEEYFVAENEYVAVRQTTVEKPLLKENAQIESYFVYGKEKTPASFYYENNEGYKFLVLNFDAYGCNESVYRQYTRSRQLANASEKLCGKKLPAYICGNPDLYIMVKEDENTMSVGLWNIFPDTVFSPEVLLGESYSSIETCSCTAELNGNKVNLSDIEPYGFAFFTVYKEQ